jgi:hypothetical protein
MCPELDKITWCSSSSISSQIPSFPPLFRQSVQKSSTRSQPSQPPTDLFNKITTTSALIGATHRPAPFPPLRRAKSSQSRNDRAEASDRPVSNVSSLFLFLLSSSSTISLYYHLIHHPTSKSMEPGTPTMTGSVNSVSSTPSANPPRSRFASESPISMLVNSLKDRLLVAVPKKGECE